MFLNAGAFQTKEHSCLATPHYRWVSVRRATLLAVRPAALLVVRPACSIAGCSSCNTGMLVVHHAALLVVRPVAYCWSLILHHRRLIVLQHFLSYLPSSYLSSGAALDSSAWDQQRCCKGYSRTVCEVVRHFICPTERLDHPRR